MIPDFDQKTFFDYVRRAPFGNRLSQSQVDGIGTILAAWQAQCPGGDDRWLAYILATAFHETGSKMQPVREGFAKTDVQARRVVAARSYGKPDPVTGEVYYGRGHVQLTWPVNYKTLGRVLGQPLYEHPDLALDPTISAHILVEGMIRGASGKGDFTGKSLENYFSSGKDDPEGARHIINGTDKASLIAGYHRNFLDSIAAARAAAKVKAPPAPSDGAARPSAAAREAASDQSAETASAAPSPHFQAGDKPPLHRDPTTIGAIVAGLGGSAGVIGTIVNQVSNPWALAAFAIVAVGLFLIVTGRLKIRYDSGS